MAAQVLHEAHGLPRRVVMKAEHHEVDLGQDLPLGGGILAPLRVDAPDRDAGNVLQALANAEAGRACLAVDEDGLRLEARA